MFSYLKKLTSVSFLFFLSIFMCSGWYVPQTGVDYYEDFYSSDVRAVNNDIQTVYLGGQVLGYSFISDGLLVVSNSSVLTENGFFNTLPNKELVTGDVIESINGEKVSSAADIEKLINSEDNKGKTVKINAKRKGKAFSVDVKPAYDLLAKRYKLGVWVQNQLSGVGTVTYIKKDGRYGALGHPIIEGNTGQIMNVQQGSVYDCSVLGIKPAKYGTTGEILGAISRKEELGSLDKNCNFGVYGNLDSNFKNNLNLQEIEVAGRSQIKVGKAEIYCALDGENIKSYDIEIIKTNYQSVSNNKSLVFKLVDKELIAKTGGIIQGMSGSPIVQNGKLVGAVTHVFINDATKGFGIYIDWMINN